MKINNKEKKLCSIKGCDRSYSARGYCSRHYNRLARHGNPLAQTYIRNGGLPCKVEDCEDVSYGHQYCKYHYTQYIRHGDPLIRKAKYGRRDKAARKAYRIENLMENSDSRSKCSIPGCDKRQIGKGYCNPHYQRFKKYGDPLSGGNCSSMIPIHLRCSIHGCAKKAKSKSYCQMHYWRLKVYGNPLYVNPNRSTNKGLVCTVEDCTNKALSKDYCNMHYQRFWKHGDPLHKRTTSLKGKKIGPYSEERRRAIAKGISKWHRKGKSKGTLDKIVNRFKELIRL